MNSSIQPFRSSSYDSSAVSSKASSHRVRFSAFSFNFQYPLVSLRSSRSCLRLLPRLPLTYMFYSILTSITCFRRQFLRKMWPIQLAYLTSILCRIFLSFFSLCNWCFSSHMIGPTELLHPSSTTFQTFQVFLIYFPKCPCFSTIQSYAALQMWHITSILFKFKSNLLVKESFLVECCFCHGNPGFNYTSFWDEINIKSRNKKIVIMLQHIHMVRNATIELNHQNFIYPWLIL